MRSQNQKIKGNGSVKLAGESVFIKYFLVAANPEDRDASSSLNVEMKHGEEYGCKEIYA